ncbi:hypothetical protein NE237_002460 [Protea cynaroides]|uniref:Uncharacterized protein n=1 Tax=Protea cynaroides TaxID=273540 RepID=A0A9Q0QZE4_9MAGN|nr:hypothetical protein NE237_002460 [Protea cynaroides]
MPHHLLLRDTSSLLLRDASLSSLEKCAHHHLLPIASSHERCLNTLLIPFKKTTKKITKAAKTKRREVRNPLMKVQEQEPEMLPCYASASPLSSQLSTIGTLPIESSSIKVWYPCNVLAQPPLLPPDTLDDD